MDLIAIKPGTYQRGGEQDAKTIAEVFREPRDLWEHEHPRHEVTLTKPFLGDGSNARSVSCLCPGDRLSHRRRERRQGRQ